MCPASAASVGNVLPACFVYVWFKVSRFCIPEPSSSSTWAEGCLNLWLTLQALAVFISQREPVEPLDSVGWNLLAGGWVLNVCDS